jgi:hypothetical protein
MTWQAPWSSEGLLFMLDVLATVILVGMMFVPVINLFVGIIVGGAAFAVWGAAGGAAIAVLITIAEHQVLDWRQLRSARGERATIPASGVNVLATPAEDRGLVIGLGGG